MSHSFTIKRKGVRNSFPGNRRTRMENSSEERRRRRIRRSHEAKKQTDNKKKAIFKMTNSTGDIQLYKRRATWFKLILQGNLNRKSL